MKATGKWRDIDVEEGKPWAIALLQIRIPISHSLIFNNLMRFQSLDLLNVLAPFIILKISQLLPKLLPNYCQNVVVAS